MNMHVHSFREITDHLAKEDVGYPLDEILHVFECECGFTLIEKKRRINSDSGKKTTVYAVVRKNEPSSPKYRH